MKRPLTVFIFSVVLMGIAQAQYTSLNEETKSMIDEGKKTTAVLDFEARGINEREAKTLTDRFSSALGKTNKVILVQRTMMKEILELLKNEPKLLNINNHIDPYEGFKKSIMNDM